METYFPFWRSSSKKIIKPLGPELLIELLEKVNLKSRIIISTLFFLGLISFSSCQKCTTCKVANDGNGNELTYPEYCSRNKDDIETFKKEVEAEANKNFTLYSCNDK